MKRLKPVLFLSFALVACSGTERTRRTFPMQVEAKSASLVTDSDWTISLTEAKASLASARFFTGKVLLSRRWSPMELVVSTAWAHPGHYQQGEALGELLMPLEVDLLSGAATPWGTANAVTGDYGSVQLGYGAAGLRVKGTATKGGTSVPFTASFTPAAPLEGLQFEQVMTTAPGVATISFDLHTLLSRMDFSQVGASATPLDTASVAFNGYARGIEDTTSYTTTWSN